MQTMIKIKGCISGSSEDTDIENNIYASYILHLSIFNKALIFLKQVFNKEKLCYTKSYNKNDVKFW